jgi:hypothetical protein
MTQRQSSPAGDVASALTYLGALGVMLATLIVGYNMFAAAAPAHETETSGAAPATEASGSSRLAAWRQTVEEARQKFQKPSAALLPPTPFYPGAQTGPPPRYDLAARRQAQDKMAEKLTDRMTAQSAGPSRSRARAAQKAAPDIATSTGFSNYSSYSSAGAGDRQMAGR